MMKYKVGDKTLLGEKERLDAQEEIE